MVSRRVAAALGAVLLLAQRRRADLAGSRAHRRRVEALRLRFQGSRVFHRDAGSPRWAFRADPAIPAYEDVWHYLWKERRLPVNVDPLESQLDDPEDRARLAKVFEQGLDHVVGYALPLKPTGEGPRHDGWVSGPWFFRQERMFLIPGDSPMGFRLPLDSIPWSAPADRQFLEALDPMATAGRCPSARNWSSGDRDADRALSLIRNSTMLTLAGAGRHRRGGITIRRLGRSSRSFVR